MRIQLATAAVLALGACDAVYGLDGREEKVDATIDGPNADLVAHFTMDSIDDTLPDSSGYGHSGSCQSACPTPTDGRIEGALHFDGTMAIAVVSDEALETTSAFTIAGWYRIDAGAPALGYCPFNKMHEQDSNTWQLCFSSDRRVRFYTTDDGILEGNAVSVGVWNHVVLWWDGSTKRLYVNGIPGPTSMDLTTFNGGIVGIGADYDHGLVAAPFLGDLDDLRIYKRALSPDEILQLATAL